MQEVSMVYGEKPALKELSFTVPAGTSLAVIGPTAAGKTQLLYLLTGLISPTGGRILFDGENIEAYKKEIFTSRLALCSRIVFCLI